MKFTPPVAPEDEKRLTRLADQMQEFEEWLRETYAVLADERLIATFHALAMHVLKLDQRVAALEVRHSG